MKRMLSMLLAVALLLCSCATVQQGPGIAESTTPDTNDPLNPMAENLEWDPTLTEGQRNRFADLLPLYRLDQMPEFDAPEALTQEALIQYALFLDRGKVLQDGSQVLIDAKEVETVADRYFGCSLSIEEDWLPVTPTGRKNVPMGRLAAWSQTERDGQKIVSLKIFCYYPFTCFMGEPPTDLSTFDYELQGVQSEIGEKLHNYAQKQRISYYEAATRLIELGEGDLPATPQRVIHVNYLSSDGVRPDRFLSCKIGRRHMDKILYGTQD